MTTHHGLAAKRIPSETPGLPHDATEVVGVLQTIRWHGNGFLIGMLKDGTAIKGPMVDPQLGVEYRLKGRVEIHPQHGAQFKFTSYESSIPTDVEAFASYLASNAKWIGPTTARLIAQEFGADCVRVCREEPERVAKIKGVTPERAAEISAMLREREKGEALEIEVRRLLQGTTLGQVAITKIIAAYGSEAPTKVRENPYQLIDDVDGIGFRKADEIALRVGYPETGRFRLRAGVKYVLGEFASGEGHVCVPKGYLLKGALELLDKGLDSGEGNYIPVKEEILRMVDDGDLVMEADFVYLPRLYRDEGSLAESLVRLAQAGVKVPDYLNVDGLKPDQVNALEMASKSAVFVLTGAPGTGKTTTIKSIMDISNGIVELAAPTGKAAKRIQEQIGEKGVVARTIHRLLQPMLLASGRWGPWKGGLSLCKHEETSVDPSGKEECEACFAIREPVLVFGFGRTREVPIEADMVLIDETSMVDVSLAARLLEAVKTGTRVVFIGDSHQLPAVGPGTVLSDISKAMGWVELTEIKRQGPRSRIVEVCHDIKNGKTPTLKARDGDLSFIEADGVDEIALAVSGMVDVLMRSPAGLSIDDIQVIVPLRKKTDISAEALNKRLRAQVNPPKMGDDDRRFRVGDKVIQTKNDYFRDAMNGDIGFVESVGSVPVASIGGKPTAIPWADYAADLAARKERIPVNVHPVMATGVLVAFDNPSRRILFPYENALDHAYALTCHKFQGSEAPAVIIPVCKSYGPRVADRRWIYTAISRARDLCVIVGEREEFAKIISRNTPQRRYSRLLDRILAVNQEAEA